MTYSGTYILRMTNALAVAAGADLTSPVVQVPHSGVIVEVRYIPTTVLTGADTNSRTLTLFNRGPANAGTTVIAQTAYTNGINIAANTAGNVTLSVTPANLRVSAGDTLDWESLHVGTGLADPGGVVEVEILPDRTGRQPVYP